MKKAEHGIIHSIRSSKAYSFPVDTKTSPSCERADEI